MSAQPKRYPVKSPEPATREAEPTVFVRTLTVPPGFPWDQSKIAALEARSGTPLPLGEVVYQLRRLDPWWLGRGAHYAAFYVHARNAAQAFRSTVEVNGRQMQVHFSSAAERRRRVRDLSLLAGVTAGVALILSAAATTAWNVRVETAERLDALARIAAAKARMAQATERQRLMARALGAEDVHGLELDAVLADLAWASRAKAPDVRIDGVHWDHGHLAVEVRGEAEPFVAADRAVVKANKPLRGNEWLWGVEPARASGAAR